MVEYELTGTPASSGTLTGVWTKLGLNCTKTVDVINGDATFTLPQNISITSKEKDILKYLLDFPNIIDEAATNYSPAVIANYVYDLVKSFNHYYQHTPIFKAPDEDLIRFRLALSKKVGEVIKNSMDLLGISVPDRM